MNGRAIAFVYPTEIVLSRISIRYSLHRLDISLLYKSLFTAMRWT